MSHQRQRLFFSRQPQIDTADANDTVRGYAAVFGQSADGYKPGHGYGRWIVRAGAFSAALAGGADVVALVNHNRNQVLGRLAAGTLALAEDDTGLAATLTPCATTLWSDVLENLRAGNLTGMSFDCTFLQGDLSISVAGDGITCHEILKVATIIDVSIVTDPFFAGARAWIAPGQEPSDSLAASRDPAKPAPRLHRRERLDLLDLSNQ